MAALLGAPRSTIIKDWKTDSNRLTVGYLSKHRRGAWGKWRNRWCVLDHKTKELSWYTDEKAGGKALGSIVLTGVRSWPGYDNALEFRAAKAIYYAKCEDKDTQTRWLLDAGKVCVAEFAAELLSSERSMEMVLKLQGALRRKHAVRTANYMRAMALRRRVSTGSVWVSVTVKAARGLKAADINGFSDPYCIVTAGVDVGNGKRGTFIGRTKTVPKCLDPVWNEEHAAHASFGKEFSECGLTIKVWDEDTLTDDLIGVLTIDCIADASSTFKWLKLAPKGEILVAVNVKSEHLDQVVDKAVIQALAGGTAQGDTIDNHLSEEERDRCRATMRAIRTFAPSQNKGASCVAYSTLVSLVLRGRLLADSVMGPGGASGFRPVALPEAIAALLGEEKADKPRPPLDKKQCVCEMVWWLYSMAAAKNSAFASGAMVVEDPGWRLFNTLAPTAYCRAFKQGKPEDAPLAKYKPETFGSSHLIETLRLFASLGSWRLPEDRVAVALEEGHKSSGYYQLGIDIHRGAGAAARNQSVLGKNHILFGKLPPKDKAQEQEFLFLKFETYGNQGAADTVLHGFQFAQSVKRRTSKKDEKATTRKERTEKSVLKSFKSIVAWALAEPRIPLLADEAVPYKEHLRRGKHFGLSYMAPVVESVAMSIKSVFEREDEAYLAKLTENLDIDSDSDEDASSYKVPLGADDSASDDSDSDDDLAEDMQARKASGGPRKAQKRDGAVVAVPPKLLLQRCDEWTKLAFRDSTIDHAHLRYGREVILTAAEMWGSAAEAAAETAADQWAAHETDAGVPYWYNHVTQESVWEDPAA